MATWQIPLFDSKTQGDLAGHCFPEPDARFLTNDFYGGFVWGYDTDASTFGCGGSIKIPPNYVGSAVVRGTMIMNATSGAARMQFRYTSIDAGETFDPSADQEAVAADVTAAGTAYLIVEFSISLTSTNLAANDILKWSLDRLGAHANDTLAVAARVVSLHLEYADA